MKVLLISANVLISPYPVYPLGLDYVAAALDEKHTVEITDMNLADLDAVGRRIDEFQPDAVGVSLRNIDNTDNTAPMSFMSGYRQLVYTIRQHCKAPIILGGAGFSILPEELMAALSADYGIVGEGHRMAALMDALENHQPVESLPGVVTPQGGAADSTQPDNGSPRRCFDPHNKHLSFYLRQGGMLNLQTKRGCPFRCIYCTYPRIEGRRMRLIAPDEVAHTAKALQDAGAKYLFIADSAFNADAAHSLAVVDQFRQVGLSIPWGAFLAPMTMPQRYFRRLAAAGLTHAEFGTESLSNRVLASYCKPFKREHAKEAHQRANQAGMHVAHYFLLGGPGETRETLDVTLYHIDQLTTCVLFLFCGMRIYPQTALYQRALVENLIAPEQEFLEPVFYHSAQIGRDEIIAKIEAAAHGRPNWVMGSADDPTSDLLTRMYAKGYTGPLWEYLIR